MPIMEMLLKLTLVIFMVGNMLDMGLRLRLDAAIRGLRDTRFVILTLLWGFVLLPAIALAITKLIPMSSPHATGLVLLAMTPCAPFLPMMADRAHGDMGYTAALLIFTCVVTVAYMPFAVPLFTKGLTATAWSIAKPLVTLVFIPFIIGIALQQFSGPLAVKVHPLVKRGTGIDTLGVLVLCGLIYGKDILQLAGSYAIGAEILFFAIATMAPYLLGFGLPRGQKVVISLGMATRNLGAAFAPLIAVRGSAEGATVMVALGVLMQTMSSFGAASYYRRIAQTSSAPAGAGKSA